MEMDTPRKMELGFVWWDTYGWLGIILGGAAIAAIFDRNALAALALVSLNTGLMVLVIRKNKYAFLLSTLISLNPILWIANLIYLKNRWDHPEVNRSASVLSKTKVSWWALDKNFRLMLVASMVWAFLAYYIQDSYERDLAIVFIPAAGMLAFYLAYTHLVAPSKSN